MPGVHDFGALGFGAAGAHDEGNAPMVDGHGGLHITRDHREKIPPAPKGVAFPLDKAPRCLAGLAAQVVLLGANPA